MKEMSVKLIMWVSFITQDLVEKVVVLQRAVEVTQKSGPAAIGILLAEKMSQYANLLASQGSLSTAIKYLPDNTNQVGFIDFVQVASLNRGEQIHLMTVSCGPCRLPYSSFASASVVLWGSRRLLQQLQHMFVKCTLSSLPQLSLCPSTHSPRSNPPWCLDRPLQLLYPSLLLRPLRQHIHSIISLYVR